uniref:Uncharacterized protein n=1 Tax=Candidatus Kentrum sp. TUN TaxID=2126343 RepID=A0A451A6Z9_9GAMM|nr:MAG: hypothetical protein BECKTUN1418F_GA0071002_12722 [Candidatus Kentron sp. TUN]VFK70905.1 MAG: hypothetical protein BECKTUN1418E_GA0071001_12752 [Candidatus Kentron sp. TUN]
MRWISTPNSVENNEPTALAIVETVLAVAAYWGIAWAFDTHLHLLVSICVAPLLLLRSPESTEEGVRWFAAYITNKKKITRKDTPWRFWGMILLAFFVGAACTYGLAQTLLVEQAGWALFARAFGMGLLAMMMGFMVTAALVGVLALAAAAARAEAVAAAGAVAGAGVVAGVVVVAVAGTRVKILGVLVFGISVAAGIWLRSLAVRVLATARHPWRGLATLPENWQRILWALDSRHPPELLPGLSAELEVLSLSYWMEGLRVEDWGGRLVSALSISIFFLPGLLYRWSLKSTCWLYLPLIYLGGGLRRPRTPKEKGELVAGLYKSRWEMLRRLLAIGVVGSAVITTLDSPETPKCLQSFAWSLEHLEHFFPPYLWAFNLFHLAPWQWLNLLGAAITGVLWIYSDRVNRIWTLAKEKDPDNPPEAGYVAQLQWMTRLRNLCIILYFPLALGYGVLALKGVDGTEFTGWLAWLGALFGLYL